MFEVEESCSKICFAASTSANLCQHPDALRQDLYVRYFCIFDLAHQLFRISWLATPIEGVCQLDGVPQPRLKRDLAESI